MSLDLEAFQTKGEGQRRQERVVILDKDDGGVRGGFIL